MLLNPILMYQCLLIIVIFVVSMFEFKLGTHVLSHIEKTDVPLFISFRQLKKRKNA